MHGREKRFRNFLMKFSVKFVVDDSKLSSYSVLYRDRKIGKIIFNPRSGKRAKKEEVGEIFLRNFLYDSVLINSKPSVIEKSRKSFSIRKLENVRSKRRTFKKPFPRNFLCEMLVIDNSKTSILG